jgi:hypothetical protein
MKQRWIARWVEEGKQTQLIFDSEESYGVARVDFQLTCMAHGMKPPEAYQLIEGVARAPEPRREKTA